MYHMLSNNNHIFKIQADNVNSDATIKHMNLDKTHLWRIKALLPKVWQT